MHRDWSRIKGMEAPDAFSTLSDAQADFLGAIRKAEVRYLVVGGYAVRFHSAGRDTEDLDLFVCPNSINAARVAEVLGCVGRTVDTAAVRNRLGRSRQRVLWRDIDLLTSIDGVPDFDAAFSRAVLVRAGALYLWVISKADLVLNKMTRKDGDRDNEDIGLLEN